MPCALPIRSEEHTSELQSPCNLVCRLLLEKKNGPVAWCWALPLYISGPCRPSVWPCRTVFREADPSRFLFFNDTATTEIYSLSLHDALPIYCDRFGPKAAGVLKWMLTPGV